MITYKTEDLLAEDAEALVYTVNCVGVMGRGIALQFKKNPKAAEDLSSTVNVIKRAIH